MYILYVCIYVCMYIYIYIYILYIYCIYIYIYIENCKNKPRGSFAFIYIYVKINTTSRPCSLKSNLLPLVNVHLNIIGRVVMFKIRGRGGGYLTLGMTFHICVYFRITLNIIKTDNSHLIYCFNHFNVNNIIFSKMLCYFICICTLDVFVNCFREEREAWTTIYN